MKIIGATVGTPLSPTVIKDKLNLGTSVARNLLDNSDFRNPVNQRGFVGDRVHNCQYFIDRWLAYDHTGTDSVLNVTLSDNGLVLNPSEASLTQYFPNVSKYFGKTFTVGIGLADGTVYAYSGLVPNAARGLIVENNNDKFWMFVQTYDGVNGIVSFRPYQNITVSWIALYEGEYTSETLPEYQPKGYSAELLECFRYYYSLRAWTYHPGLSNYNGTTCNTIIHTIVPMRVKPSLSGDGAGNGANWIIYADGKSFTPSAVSIASLMDNMVNIQLATSGISAYVITQNGPKSTFGLSADL